MSTKKYIIHQRGEESQKANKDSNNITFKLILFKSSREKWLNNPYALAQSDAKRSPSPIAPLLIIPLFLITI